MNPPEATVEAVELLAIAQEINGEALSCAAGLDALGFPSAAAQLLILARALEAPIAALSRITPTVSREGEREAELRAESVYDLALQAEDEDTGCNVPGFARRAALRAMLAFALPAPPQHGEDVA